MAQSNEEIDELKGLFSKNESVKYSLKYEQKNEYHLFVDLLFTGYKNFISPFDSQSCSFYPSCSVYAIESIEKKGFIIGILNSCDRLMRCNGLSPELYTNYKNSKLLFDPVK